MADKSLMDKFMSLPKWLQAVFEVIIVLLLGYGFYTVVSPSKPQQVDPSTIVLDMPEAAAGNYDRSRVESYRDGDFHGEMTGNAVDDYWNSLGKDLVSGKEESQTAGQDDMSWLDGGEYSEEEKRMIRSGLKTRAEIDAEHADMRAFEESIAAGTSAKKELTPEQEDSVYFARMERTYQLALKYQPNYGAVPVSGTATDDESEEEENQAEEPRRLNLDEPTTLPADSFMGDDIITSLDSPSSSYSSSGPGRKPVKATFLKNEKLSSGERVIMRLMQDLVLSDGTVIPTNTHITGVCSFSDRLKIHISSLHYGGKMMHTDIDIYDNDGTEGIYCPLAAEAKRKSRNAKKMAADAVSAAGSVAGTVLTGSSFLGNISGSGISTLTGMLNSDGSITVSIVAGYEFYVFENVKKENGTKEESL